MTRRLQLIVLIGVIAAVGVGFAQVRDTRPVPSAPPPAPAGTAAISGLATSEDGSRPVRFAYVLLIGTTTGRNDRECGQIGVIAIVPDPTVTIGPPAAKLYAVEPDGVAMMIPSPANFT